MISGISSTIQRQFGNILPPLAIRRSAPPQSGGLNRSLRGSPQDCHAIRSRPFGFESLDEYKKTIYPHLGDILFWRKRWDLYRLQCNPPFCAAPVRRLEPLPTWQSTGLSRYTVAPFRVRIPQRIQKNISPFRGYFVLAEAVG